MNLAGRWTRERREAAWADLVLGADGSVDAAATEALRADITAQRDGDDALFNFGGDVEEIRARCEADTHLPAPVKPTFQGSA